MTKREIVEKMNRELGIRQQTAAIAVQFTLDAIKNELLNGGSVELRNFGVFEVAMRKARIGRNPNAPQKDVKIPARKVIKFKMGKRLRDALNS